MSTWLGTSALRNVSIGSGEMSPTNSSTTSPFLNAFTAGMLIT